MLSSIGLSHKSAPLLVREHVAFGEAELPPALRSLRSLPGVSEALLLSTCNRSEVYMVTGETPPLPAIVDLLGSLRDVHPSVFESFLTVRLGEDAARHILRVASGLESMIVGESQILGQVRRAFAAAGEIEAAGPVLHRLLQLAIATGRRVRARTGLGHRTASVPHAAVALCRSTWGALEGHAVGIIGAGEAAALAAKAFHEGGAVVKLIANRTLGTAAVLAARYRADALGLDEIPLRAEALDALVVSVGADHHILDRSVFEPAVSRSSPLLVVDIGVRRGVDPTVGRLPGITLYDLDALVPDHAQYEPSAEDVGAAEAIVEETLEVFVRWLASRAAVPVIAALHRRAEAIVDEELLRAGARLRGLDERQRRAVRGVVEGALRKLLHAPFVRLRARGDDAGVLALARELFDLEGEGKPG
jgi:glutamyl-tRNA reductase